LKEYLRELAETRAKESIQGLQDIHNKLKAYQEKEPSLAGYVAFVDELAKSRVRHAEIEAEKKRLEEMRGVLQRHKASDDASFSAVGHSFGLGGLAGKIETLSSDLLNTSKALDDADDQIKQERERHVEDLEEKVREEEGKLALRIEELATNDALHQASSLATEALAEAGRCKSRFDKSVRLL
jgi:hypothetical protein